MPDRVSSRNLLEWIDWLIDTGAAGRGVDHVLVKPMANMPFGNMAKWRMIRESMADIVRMNPDVLYDGRLTFRHDSDAVAFALQFS